MYIYVSVYIEFYIPCSCDQMSAPYIQLHLIIFIWLLTAGHCLTSVIVKQDDDRVIIIDQDGTVDLECCMYGNCLCSNISLALEHLQGDTEIRVQSDISLHNIVVFGNISNVKLAGDNSPTVRCDHQGGLVGKNINYIVIQGITWDSCNGITILNFSGVNIIRDAFLNFIHFAVTLHGLGSVNINGSIFSHNNGSIDVLASSVNIYGSEFYADRKTAILVNTMSNDNTLALHNVSTNVTVEYCRFNNISEHCVYCIGNAGLLSKVYIIFTNFTNNTNTAVNDEHCNVTLNNVTFYNNVNINSGYINDGGAVRVYNSMLYMTGEVSFSYNRAGSNGGAIYLDHSVVFASQGSFLFHNNTADYGGAVYIGQGSRLNTMLNKTSLELSENHATFNGGALYVDLHHINDVTISSQLSSYYEVLMSRKCTCKSSSTAIMCNCGYFNKDTHSPIFNFTNPTASSLSCFIDPYSNSTVFINDKTDIYTNNYTLRFWTHDLYFSIDCYDTTDSVTASFKCCYDETIYNCTIYNRTSGCVMTDENAIIECSDSNSIICEIMDGSNVYVTVQRHGQVCDDIAHVYTESGYCWSICPPNVDDSSFYSQNCVPQSMLPGYWYDNAFTQYVKSCPTGCCNENFNIADALYNQLAIFPDRDLQCNAHWGGLACGECNYSAGYAIKYDTTKCVPVDECLTTSVTSSLLILFGVSFFYWIAVISFLFVLLHFRFDITAGYAYGLLFYYSVLEQIVNDATDHLTKSLEVTDGNDADDEFNDYSYDLMRLNILPFLSSVGNLKPPFTGFMRLCLGDAEMIDHLMLEYIHPLIVTFLVVTIFLLARNFVLVARTIGRYVNSKSICILLLLSYSSIANTSMQLLKPLPVFSSSSPNPAIQVVYWSPATKYFHGRHILYGIIAILCELVIGIGLPLFLVFQKYLIRYCNINFTSMKHVTDQLMGCYKEEYRWFAAYYLICRQVLYVVINLIDLCSGFWDYSDYATTAYAPFLKFTIILIVCILIMFVHVLLQPYRKKGLNILDSFILLSLVGLLLSGLEIYWNRIISIIFWFLPLLILINYLAYFTKLKYLIILFTCIAIFGTTLYLSTYAEYHSILFVFGTFTILFLASSSIVFVAYIIYLLKCLYTRCCRGRPRYLAINEQNDEVDDNNDDNITEVYT